jgi:solute carrier family 30 (zinc transporter), member 5/7
VAGYTTARVWPKDPTSFVGSIHIQVSEGEVEQLDTIVERVDNLLHRRVAGLEELTIQVERL